MNALQYLDARRSTPSRQLAAPGPTPDQLEKLLISALRVPDHGKLTPFRLLLIEGDARLRLGAELAELHRRKEPNAPPAVLDKDRERYSFAPIIVAVIARLEPNHPKVPEQEQLLTAGCVAYNLLLGAQALGFGAQWLTGWAAYDRDAAKLLGIHDEERIVAFVHIGTAQEPAPERIRPSIAATVSHWNG